MDSRGHWHDGNSEFMRKFQEAQEVEKPTQAHERPVIAIDIGEMVKVEKSNGESLRVKFAVAEKNKVTLMPQDEGPRPYLELAEHVRLCRANGESVKAQVWDNRGGKLILRTLPL